MTPTSDQGYAQLFTDFCTMKDLQQMLLFMANNDDEALDAVETMAEAAMATAKVGEHEAIEQRLVALQEIRAEGREEVLAELEMQVAEQSKNALEERLLEWIQTDDWDSSQAYLQEHADELLNDAGKQVSQMLLQANEGHKGIQQHVALLQLCLEQGIDTAYTQLRQMLAETKMLQENPLLQGVMAFLGADDETEARAVLEENREQLLLLNTRQMIEDLLEMTKQGGDEKAQRQIQERLALWEVVRLGCSSTETAG